METVLVLFALQGLLGAFDTLYHHEFTERLPWRTTAGKELWLHGIRNFIYFVIFISLAWVEWQGVWAWLFISLLVIEILITLWDFVVEDKTRKLPATERITHTILAINYGAILALLLPELLHGSQQDNGFHAVNHGVLSWILSVYALGVLFWAFRDYLRSRRLQHWRENTAALPGIALDAGSQRILVTGGTGMIGSRLCQELINAGHDVTILTRDKAHAAGLFQGRITLIDTLEGYAAPQDIVINLAGAPISVRWTPHNREQILQSRLQTTRQLIAYMERCPQKPHTFISGSAIGYYGNSNEQVFDESSAPVDHGFAASLCQQWEQQAQAAEALGVRLCSLRTGIVLGMNGGVITQLLFPYEFGLGGKIGHGRQMMSWIHIDDLIGIITLCINDKTLSGPVNGTAPEPVTNARFSHAFAQAMHRPDLMTLPAFNMKLVFGEMAESLLLQGQSVLPKKALAHGYQFRFSQVENAFQDLLEQTA